MKKLYLSILFLTVFNLAHYGEDIILPIDTNDSMVFNFEKGAKEVNHCTPWHHMRCVAITGTEVYEDGRDGKKGRHWWRMSYIGRACTHKYGKFWGTMYEGVWALPHYTGIAVGSGFGWMVYALRGPRDLEKVAKRQGKRDARKDKRRLKKEEKQQS